MSRVCHELHAETAECTLGIQPASSEAFIFTSGLITRIARSKSSTSNGEGTQSVLNNGGSHWLISKCKGRYLLPCTRARVTALSYKRLNKYSPIGRSFLTYRSTSKDASKSYPICSASFSGRTSCLFWVIPLILSEHSCTGPLFHSSH